jgi:hypothetical protein
MDAIYLVDDEPGSDCTLAELREANRDAPLPEELDRELLGLAVGQTIARSFGAGGVVVFRRIA